ncbi:unnamed protein product [Sphagnum jensenii]|uniref:Uncharacterized protein n=1 Tax=Sphagnum jensenii TaxID=128206 RepID=A0ABP0VBF6_9BRYO
MTTLDYATPHLGAIGNFTQVREARRRDQEKRSDLKAKSLLNPTRPIVHGQQGLARLINPRLALAAAAVVKSLCVVPPTAPVVVKPVAEKPPEMAPTATITTPVPSASSDAFRGRMVGILSAPKQVTKDDLIGLAGTYSVTVKKAWKKDQILTVLAEACGLTYTP